MDKLNQIVQILSGWFNSLDDFNGLQALCIWGGLVVLLVLTGIIIKLDRQMDSKTVGTIKALTIVLVAVVYTAATTGFFSVMGLIVRLIDGWMMPAMVLGGCFLAWLMRKYRTVQVIVTLTIGIIILLTWHGMNKNESSSQAEQSSVVEQVQKPEESSGLTDLRRQLAGIVESKDKTGDNERHGFVQGDFSAGEVVRILIILIILIATSLRLYQAVMGVGSKDNRVCARQWLMTLSPQTKEPMNYNFLFFWPPTVLFIVFNLLLMSIFAFPWKMLNMGIGYFFGTLVMCITLVLLYGLSTLVKLRTAEKLIYEWFGEDVYDSRFYFWEKEKMQGTLYKGPLLKKFKHLRGFRKGIHPSLLSVWLPSALLRAYIFREEVLEIDTYVGEPYATSKTLWPETDKFDGQTPEDLEKIGEAGPEVETELNVSVWKYIDPEPYLPMADEDRQDEVNFVKRKIIAPALARFTGRMTMDQAVTARLLKSRNFKCLMDGKLVTFSEYLGERLHEYGWDLKNVETGDCNQPKAIREAQEALKVAETAVQTAIQEAKQISAKAKGEGERLLNTLKPLADALRDDPTLAAAMAYNAQLQLVEGQNRIFAMVPGGEDMLRSLQGALNKIAGANKPPRNTPSS